MQGQLWRHPDDRSHRVVGRRAVVLLLKVLREWTARPAATGLHDMELAMFVCAVFLLGVNKVPRLSRPPVGVIPSTIPQLFTVLRDQCVFCIVLRRVIHRVAGYREA